MFKKSLGKRIVYFTILTIVMLPFLMANEDAYGYMDSDWYATKIELNSSKCGGNRPWLQLEHQPGGPNTNGDNRATGCCEDPTLRNPTDEDRYQYKIKPGTGQYYFESKDRNIQDIDIRTPPADCNKLTAEVVESENGSFRVKLTLKGSKDWGYSIKRVMMGEIVGVVAQGTMPANGQVIVYDDNPEFGVNGYQASVGGKTGNGGVCYDEVILPTPTDAIGALSCPVEGQHSDSLKLNVQIVDENGKPIWKAIQLLIAVPSGDGYVTLDYETQPNGSFEIVIPDLRDQIGRDIIITFLQGQVPVPILGEHFAKCTALPTCQSWTNVWINSCDSLEKFLAGDPACQTLSSLVTLNNNVTFADQMRFTNVVDTATECSVVGDDAGWSEWAPWSLLVENWNIGSGLGEHKVCGAFRNIGGISQCGAMVNLVAPTPTNVPEQPTPTNTSVPPTNTPRPPTNTPGPAPTPVDTPEPPEIPVTGGEDGPVPKESGMVPIWQLIGSGLMIAGGIVEVIRRRRVRKKS